MTDMKETDLKERAYEEQERKRLDSIWWGGAFIWVGLVLGAEWLDILPNLGRDTGSWWPWIFVGIGPWALGMNLYRSFTDLPNPNTWDWVWAAIFMVTAIGAFIDFSGEIAGATALVIIGALIIFNTMRKK